jgi:hypothetical protein
MFSLKFMGFREPKPFIENVSAGINVSKIKTGV